MLKNSKTDEQKTGKMNRLDRATGWLSRVFTACVSCDVLLEIMDKTNYNTCVSCDCLEVPIR